MIQAILFSSFLVEALTQRIKELGVKGYSGLISLGLGVLIAIAAHLNVLPIFLGLPLFISYAITGVVIGGGSNFVNLIRDWANAKTLGAKTLVKK